MDMEDTVLTQLRMELETTQPELAAVFYELEDLYERKLWHQLCQTMGEYVFHAGDSKAVRLRLYQSFVSEFSDKVNQLQNVEFLVQALVDAKPEDALECLQSCKDKVSSLAEKNSQKYNDLSELEIKQALIQLDLELAKVKLSLGFADEAASIIDAAEGSIEKLPCSVDMRVNSSLYSAKARLSKVRGDHNTFYYQSLLFLACINDLDLLENKSEIVKNICISGILGDMIYNFGEIIMHDIMKYLEVTWLKEMLFALNSGDLKSFDNVLKSAQNESIIKENSEFLNQKMCIMGFIEMVFNSNKKVHSYAEILHSIPLLKNDSEVEHLVMKCLSLGLIKGSILAVNSQIEVSWIQPRTMTQQQIAATKDRLAVWSERAANLHQYMANHGKEVYV